MSCPKSFLESLVDVALDTDGISVGVQRGDDGTRAYTFGPVPKTGDLTLVVQGDKVLCHTRYGRVIEINHPIDVYYEVDHWHGHQEREVPYFWEAFCC